MRQSGLDPLLLATELAALIDTLIPGDTLFPSASRAGAVGLVFDRLRTLEGETFVDALLQQCHEWSGGRALTELSAAERVELVARLERERPEWFQQLRFVTYLSYYQLPPVVRAVRTLGFDYNEAPQPSGYVMEPFDPQQDLPTSPRGAYVPTEAVERVSLEGLGDLTRSIGEEGSA
uniref:Gluconate 2-dehydrogenase subunit 3 family protein n=1 Tax=Thermomicrobium roseum TaxID=500 RepID=A0A7C5VW70_THERO